MHRATPFGLQNVCLSGCLAALPTFFFYAKLVSRHCGHLSPSRFPGINGLHIGNDSDLVYILPHRHRWTWHMS
ncbi:hypothetical protein F5Y03DRAFT_358385 [Xylaria venustula]|nr:hypothetical protein F5Y03DRAFT_358385 [Xylaria venustula]